MAELTVKGFAKKDVICDWVQYSFEFKKKAKSSSEAIKLVNDEIERFLEIMEAAGVDPEDFTTGGMHSDEKYSYKNAEEEFPFEAYKEIYLSTELKMENSNAISQIITKNAIDVIFSEMHSPKNVDEAHRDMLRMAVEDSRSKAELIAACAGKKVIGIVKVDANIKEHEESNKWAEKHRAPEIIREVPLRADNLQLDTEEVTEEVDVVWLIES